MRFLSTLLAALMLAGCNQHIDLGAVRSLAATASDARSTYASITDDYYQSCLRQAGWTLLTTGGIVTNPQNKASAPVEAIPTLPDGSPDFKSLTGPSTQAQIDKANAALSALLGRNTCDQVYRPSAEGWQRLNDVVLNYLTALGRVAGGATPTDFGFGKLVNADTGLTSAQGTALSGFLNDLFNQIFNAERRTDIATSAKGANAALIAVIAVQIKAAGTYKRQLLRERAEIDSFYRNNFQQSTRPGLEKMELLRYEVDWQTRLAEPDKKIAAADAYIASVTAIQKAHQDLVDSATNNNFTNLYATANAFIADFKPKLVAIDKAFK
jgi:hypothetical protein